VDAHTPDLVPVTAATRRAAAAWLDGLVARGGARLFTFGIGADVDASLVEQLALEGRGTAHFVRPDESVERAVSRLAQRLAAPLLGDVTVHLDGGTVRQRYAPPVGRAACRGARCRSPSARTVVRT
jgi:hypothetical protein